MLFGAVSNPKTSEIHYMHGLHLLGMNAVAIDGLVILKNA